MSPRSRPRIALSIAIASLVIGVGLFAVDRLMVAVVGTGPLTILRPSIADVLDGRVANAEREAAIASVDEWLDGIDLPGATSVGRQDDTYCRTGDNNWKVHDGYRLLCSANGRVYSSWSGDFGGVRNRAEESLTTACSDPVTEPVHLTPGPTAPIDGGRWQCPGGVTITLTFATSVGLSADDRILDHGSCAEDMRCPAGGTSSTQLQEYLLPQKWFVVHDISNTFYKDQP